MKVPRIFSLRDVRHSDAGFLFLWANDPATRQAALNTDTIAWEEHRSWLDQKLTSPDAKFWVAASEADQPLGCIRFDTTDNWESAKLSYTVAPEARGLGIGRRMVEAGVARIQSEHAGLRILAEVRTANTPSLRIFRGLSWQETGAREELVRFSSTGKAE